MITRPHRLFILLVPLVLGLVIAATLWHNHSVNDGRLVFSLDDPYIHFAMARTLSEHGVWGILPDQFCASSSTPFYTLLLGLAFLVTGPSEVWGWVFPIIGGLLTAALLTARSLRHIPGRMLAVAVTVWALIIATIPELMVSGMEATLHAVFILLWAGLVERQLTAESRTLKDDLSLAAATLIICGLRYESLFLVLPLLFILDRRGRRTTAVIVLAAAVLPGAILGLVQLANGAMLLPNTLVVKGIDDEAGVVGHLLRLAHAVYFPVWAGLIVMMSAAVYETLRHPGERRDARLPLVVIFLAGLLLHGVLAILSERRYGASLIVLGVWILIPWFGEWVTRARQMIATHPRERRTRLAAATIALALSITILPFGGRIEDLWRLPLLGHDIYLQQVQMARFLSEHYPGAAVAMNDIGTTSWAGRNHVIDLVGLANYEVARLKLHGVFDQDAIERLAKEANAPIAVVYPNWFTQQGGLPRSWIPVALWHIDEGLRISVANNKVAFYATSPAEVEPLHRKLILFNPTLPLEVNVLPLIKEGG